MTLGDVFSAISAVAASVAAVAALKALGYARETVGLGKVAAEAQQETVGLGKETASAQRDALAAAQKVAEVTEKTRRAAELDRERQRLERLSELVEAVFWNAYQAQYGASADWMRPRNLLAQALAGRHSDFPECLKVSREATAAAAAASASRARDELDAKRFELELRAAET